MRTKRESSSKARTSNKARTSSKAPAKRAPAKARKTSARKAPAKGARKAPARAPRKVAPRATRKATRKAPSKPRARSSAPRTNGRAAEEKPRPRHAEASPGSPSLAAPRRLSPDLLSSREVLRLVQACSRGATGIRNRALLILLWRAGLRIGEALALEVKDLERDRNLVHVRHGKGDKARTVGLDPQAFAVVDRWLERRRTHGLATPGRPVICTLQGRPVLDSYVRHLLKRLARRAKIGKRVHPHGLRHAHAVELAEEGWPMPLIRMQLGHASLATTDAYLRRIAPTEVLERARDRPPWHN